MFLKKKGPIDVPGGLILLPMFAAHSYNHFCTEYPPGLPAPLKKSKIGSSLSGPQGQACTEF